MPHDGIWRCCGWATLEPLVPVFGTERQRDHALHEYVQQALSPVILLRAKCERYSTVEKSGSRSVFVCAGIHWWYVGQLKKERERGTSLTGWLSSVLYGSGIAWRPVGGTHQNQAGARLCGRCSGQLQGRKERVNWKGNMDWQSHKIDMACGSILQLLFYSIKSSPDGNEPGGFGMERLLVVGESTCYDYQQSIEFHALFGNAGKKTECPVDFLKAAMWTWKLTDDWPIRPRDIYVVPLFAFSLSHLIFIMISTEEPVNALKKRKSASSILTPLLDAWVTVCERRQHYGSAQNAAERMIRLAPDHAKGYLRLFQVLVSRKQVEDAARVYREAMKMVSRWDPHYSKLAELSIQALTEYYERFRGGRLMVALPYHVLCTIFSFLPLRDRIRCTGVCRAWREFLFDWPAVWHDLDWTGPRFQYSRINQWMQAAHERVTALRRVRRVQLRHFYNASHSWAPFLLLHRLRLERLEAIGMNQKELPLLYYTNRVLAL